ncbi:serine hydrolase domain-containing protein [Natroniella sp. ANB-PHB2]|uniref:serine hydrolase domain-containing protein n=1 Tax=Natroniella sp. ANB-PHB2 TaxID=3384444 RepID=UPI0038D46516
MDANPKQPNYMASVGKLFTSTIISILFEKGELSFDDSISKYLGDELLDGLHVYKGKDYTDHIKIKHLLKQTSGLPENFWPLLEDLFEDPNFKISPREAIIWAKDNSETECPPGKEVNYTDTNYHLLGLIIENITDVYPAGRRATSFIPARS